MPESIGTYLDSPSATSSDLELRAVIAVFAQRLDELTDRVNQLDPQWKNQQALKEEQAALAAQNRRAVAEAQSHEQTQRLAESQRLARDIHERTLPLASARSISRLYETSQLTRGTYGEQELIQELKRLGWSDQ